MIIAEIGLNHMGSELMAMKMLKKLVKKKIDAVTFQIKKPSFYTEDRPYKRKLSNDFYKRAIEYTHRNNKLIGFAIADKNMVHVLNHGGADFWKTISSDFSNYNLHRKLQKTGKVTYVSTGFSNEKEIIRISKKLRNIVLIHTQKSNLIEDCNLKAISRLSECTKIKVAFGLHCSDILALYLSIAFEPADMFFYIKEDPKIIYPDDQHAILIRNLDGILEKITKLRKTIGDGIKVKGIDKIK